MIYSESSHYNKLLFQKIQEGHIYYSLNCKCLYSEGSWRKLENNICFSVTTCDNLEKNAISYGINDDGNSIELKKHL